MRVVTWNIRHGGAVGERQQRLIRTLLGFEADVLVVTEFRANDRGQQIISGLRKAGYSPSHHESPPNRNSVLVASRTSVARGRSLAPSLPDPWRLWCVDVGWCGLVAVYMPNLEAKLPYWDAVVRAMGEPSAPALLTGDFNTGRNDLDKADNATPFVGADYMKRVEDAGYVDLWRSQHPSGREYSWFSKPWNNGFRLDHAFGTKGVASMVADCSYDHAPRLEGISDHSALIVDLTLTQERLRAE